MRNFLLTTFLLVLTLYCGAQPGTLDTSFNTADAQRRNEEGANNTVRTISVQSDGRIWIGGDFTNYNGYTSNRLARLDSNGSLDAAITGGANATVYSIMRTPLGNTLIGGAYTDFSGNWYRDYLLQLTREGWMDANFDTGDGAITGEGANGTVRTIAIQGDGKVLIGGEFLHYNRVSRNRIARLKTDGTLDTTFAPGTGANGVVTAIVLQPDGKILVGGNFTTFNNIACNRLARLHPDGRLDDTFDPGAGANDAVHTMVLQNNGKIVIGGAFTTYRGASCNRITRLNSDGSIDPSFMGMANGEVTSLLLQPDGKILVGGAFTTYNGTACKQIARINTNGNLDAGFNSGSGFNAPVTTMTLQADGRILVGGSFTAYNGTARKHIARLNSDGTLDDRFYPGVKPNGPYYSVTTRKGNGIQAGGEFNSINGLGYSNYTAFNARGSLGPRSYLGNYNGINGAVTSILYLTDSTMLVAGAFTSFNGTAANRIHRIGKGEEPFTPGSAANNTIRALSVQSDGKIWIGGDFTTYNGTPRNRVARLKANGTLDSSFNPGSGANGRVKAVAVQEDGSVLVGGDFTAYNGIARNGFARLNSDGSIDGTFYAGPATGSRVESIVVQPDGKILVAGTFTSFNSTAAHNLTRLNRDGSTDTSFGTGKGANGTIHTLLLQSDGKILAGGAFLDFNGAGGRGIARLLSGGSLDTSFHPGTGVNGTVYSLALDQSSHIIMGGNFSEFNGTERQSMARLLGGPHSIAIGVVPTGPFCTNTELSIPFTATGAYTEGHHFIAELSSPSGSFKDSTLWLGSLRAISSGVIRATIPPETPAGTRYRIRVVSVAPEVEGTDNGFNLTIHAVPDTPLVATPGDTAFCAGSSLALTSSPARAYQWYKDSVAISGATAQQYIVNAPGRYSVLTTENNCASPMSTGVTITVRPAPPKPTITQQGNILTASVASGVQWLKNGEPIQGATGAEYTVQTSGLYSVQVTAGGCSVQSDAVNMITTAIVNPQAWGGEVTVFPVPVQHVLHITNSRARMLRVQLLDLAGKKIRETRIAAASSSLSMEALAPGTYLLLLTDLKKGETIARPVVKQ